MMFTYTSAPKKSVIRYMNDEMDDDLQMILMMIGLGGMHTYGKHDASRLRGPVVLCPHSPSTKVDTACRSRIPKRPPRTQCGSTTPVHTYIYKK